MSFLEGCTGQCSGNPPTQDDHKWNPNATKIAIPISDEGPKDGDPAQQRTIRPPSRKHTTTVSTQVSFQSECMDKPTAVLQASNPTSRTWPSARTVSKAQLHETVSNTIRSTDAGGQVYEFPSGSGGASQMSLLVEAMVYISTNNSREIYMSVLDPYGKMNNDPSWTPGVSGTVAQNGGYREDTGKGSEGHLVVVNDTCHD